MPKFTAKSCSATFHKRLRLLLLPPPSAVLDLIPFAGARRKMTNMNRHAQIHRQVMQRHFPQAATTAVAAASIGGDQQFFRIAISLHSHPSPPTPNRFGGKACGVVIDAHADPPLVLTQVIYAIGNRLAQLRIHEIMHLHLFWLSLRLPLAAPIPELPYQFLLLRIHRDHRLASILELLHRCVDMLELRIAVWMVCPFFGLAITL